MSDDFEDEVWWVIRRRARADSVGMTGQERRRLVASALMEHDNHRGLTPEDAADIAISRARHTGLWKRGREEPW